MLVLVIVFQHITVGGDRLKRGQAISRTRGINGREPRQSHEHRTVNCITRHG